MKKLLVLLLTVFALNSCEQDPEIIGIDAEKKQLKVEVCHYDADTDTWKTINISKNALKAHLNHGDFEGSCEETKTYVPDDSFEILLITLGYDDVKDDYVLTSNISSVESLNIPLEVQCSQLEIDGCDPGAVYSVQNLIGIEDFIGLKRLSGWTPNIFVPIDLTALINLEGISFYQSSMPSFDLPKNLKSIWIEDGDLETLDLSNNPKLEFLTLTGCFKLTCIQKGDNPLASLVTVITDVPIEIDCGY